MAEEKVMETIFGKHNKFTVVKKSDIITTKYYVYKDGKPHRGYFSSLSDAVEAAKEDAGTK